MALYFLKESPGNAVPVDTGPLSSRRLRSNLSVIVLIPLLLSGALLQALGWTWPVEKKLFDLFPATWRGSASITRSPRLLIVPNTQGAFLPVDLALALRGLGKLHPARILINGTVSPDPQSIQLLQGVCNTLQAEGITVTRGQVPSERAEYHLVPLCMYDPPLFLIPEPTTKLPTIPGKISNKDEGCFLWESACPGNGIPLFAETERGEIAGSLWWEVFRESVADYHQPSSGGDVAIWLLAGKYMVFPERVPVRLSTGGMISLQSKLDLRNAVPSTSLDDFLLGIERKERGENHKFFDGFWNNSLVIIGKDNDAFLLEAIHQSMEPLQWRSTPLVAQLLLCLCCIILTSLGLLAGRIVSLAMGLFFLLGSLAFAVWGIGHTMILPWLAPFLGGLILLFSSLSGATGFLDKRK
jgi:hypothetical protein